MKKETIQIKRLPEILIDKWKALVIMICLIAFSSSVLISQVNYNEAVSGDY